MSLKLWWVVIAFFHLINLSYWWITSVLLKLNFGSWFWGVKHFGNEFRTSNPKPSEMFTSSFWSLFCKPFWVARMQCELSIGQNSLWVLFIRAHPTRNVLVMPFFFIWKGRVLVYHKLYHGTISEIQESFEKT